MEMASVFSSTPTDGSESWPVAPGTENSTGTPALNARPYLTVTFKSAPSCDHDTRTRSADGPSRPAMEA
eukprot:3463770-Rhodomonas_salina.1